MPFPKISEVRDLSDEQLSEQILATKRELFQLRLQKATRRLEGTHQFKHAKHRLAQLLTVEGERKKATASSTSARAEASAATKESLDLSTQSEKPVESL